MTGQTRDIIIWAVAAIALILCVKRGYNNGFMTELKKLLGIAVALICIVLIMAVRGAVSEREYATVIVVIGAIIILSLGWKLLRAILGLLSGLKELPILGGIDRLLGAAAGGACCAAVIWVIKRFILDTMLA